MPAGWRYAPFGEPSLTLQLRVAANAQLELPREFTAELGNTLREDGSQLWVVPTAQPQAGGRLLIVWADEDDVPPRHLTIVGVNLRPIIDQDKTVMVELLLVGYRPGDELSTKVRHEALLKPCNLAFERFSLRVSGAEQTRGSKPSSRRRRQPATAPSTTGEL